MRSALFLLLLPLLAVRPLSAAAQQAHARVSPILVNPSSQAIGPTLRLSSERVDQSTITREDRTLLAGSELRTGQDQAVATVRTQRAETDDTGRIRARATAEQDRERHRRVAAVSE